MVSVDLQLSTFKSHLAMRPRTRILLENGVRMRRVIPKKLSNEDVFKQLIYIYKNTYPYIYQRDTKLTLSKTGFHPESKVPYGGNIKFQIFELLHFSMDDDRF